MKLGVVVVLYKPDESVVGNIVSYAPWCDYVIIWDNSPESTFKNDNDSLKAFLSIPNIVPLQYIHDGINYGLAYPYNNAFGLLQNSGITHLMTMDQDS